MKNVQVEIKGIRPILFHAFQIEAISNMSKVKTGSAGNDPEEWKRTLLEKNNQLYVPASYISGCLKEGSKYTKAGRGTVLKSFISCTIVTSDICLIDRHLPDGWQQMTAEQFEKDSSKPVYLDIRGVMNPNSKGKNIRYRVACSPGWKTGFTFTFDDTVISQAQIKKIVEDAGKMVGIGDARVLGYGRFSVENIEITNVDD